MSAANTKLIMIPGILLIFSSLILAQDATPRKLTLKEAVTLALENNPSVKASSDAVEGARAREKQARSMYWPRLDFKETFTNGNNPVYVFATKLGQQTFTAADFDIQKLNEPDPINNFKSEISLYQSIWEGGRIRAQNRIARLYSQLKQKELEQAQQMLILNVVRHYYAIQLSRHGIETARKALQSVESNLERIQNMYDNGLVVKSDLLRMQVFMADVRRRLLSAENQESLSMAALNTDLGGALGNLFEPATPLEKPDIRFPDEQHLVGLALQNRPEVLSLRAAIEIARNQVKQARSAYKPGVGVFSSLEYNKGTQTDADGGNYTLGVQLRLNIFDGFHKGAKVAEARAGVSELENKLRNLENMIALQVKDGFLTMRTAQQQYEVAQAVVAQAEEGLRITKDRYESGLATLTDLLNAETASTMARTNLSQAQYEYNVAVAELERSAGTLNTDSRLFQ